MRLLAEVLARLDAHYGPQGWWPAASRFEVIVGAVLTQNTSWTNVERALANLQSAGRLSPEGISGLARDALAELIRPSGYFNVKSRRLKSVVQWFEDAGGFERLDAMATDTLRAELLAVHGVGPETADDILLYAFDRPVFVIDAYTRRLFARVVERPPAQSYEDWRAWFEDALPRRSALYNQYHALIVVHGKLVCRPRPRCTECPVADLCAFAGAVGG